MREKACEFCGRIYTIETPGYKGICRACLSKENEKISTYDEAVKLMQNVYENETKDVSVLWDKGWGDSKVVISIIKDGNGTEPLAVINKETYNSLLKNNIIRTNDLRTAKARKNHPFVRSEC